MELYFKGAAGILLAAVLGLALQKQEKDLSAVLTAAVIAMAAVLMLRLLEPVTEGGYHWDYIRQGGSGINHICFKVHDFDYWREHFRAKGDDIFFEYEDEDEANGYRRCMYARDAVMDMIYEIKEINRYRNPDGTLQD